MRTVSFSQPQVQQQLQNQFVCYTTSTEGDPTAGESIRHRPNDPAGMCVRGNGQQNVQTLFLTPDGEIFHAATGYLAPEDLLLEMKYARDLFQQLQRETGDSKATFVANSHEQRLATLGFDSSEIQSRGLNFGMGMPLPKNLSDFSAGKGAPMSFIPGSGNASDPFAPMIRGQVLNDHQFCMDHPLMSQDSFERNPTPLIGSGKSFFMSNSSGFPGR